jgi:hypothetical protein
VQFTLLNRAHPSDALPYRVTGAARRVRWFAGTGLRPGSRVRVVGNEWDQVNPRCANPTILFHYRGAPSADSTVYRARSGATIFSGGSLQFALGLDTFIPTGRVRKRFNQADPRLQRFTCNLIADLTEPSGSARSLPAPCLTVASSSTTPDDANTRRPDA